MAHPQVRGAKPLGDQAYDAIKEDILRCRLAAGSRVTESQLGQDYDFGKAGIRAALQRLAQEGLVTSYPRHGYQVKPLTAKDVVDLFNVRLLLEPAAARLAAGRVDPQQLGELDRLCQRGYDPDHPESVEAFQEVNARFHTLVAEAAGNPTLTRLLRQVIDEMRRFFYLGLTVGVRDQARHESGHQRLVEALASGDPDRAEQVARDGILQAQRNSLDSLLSLASLQQAELSAVNPDPMARG